MIRFEPSSPVRAPELPGVARPSGPAESFSSAVAAAVNTVDAGQKSAEAEIRRFLNGEGVDIHQVALAQQQAQLSFELFLQMRNKVVQAYQEIMRMQI
ncbi:MAG: flagellar hook-basal body complex protein FliE [Bryobacteraceae bacterium]|nr:flagellar hook-basal body complex protein FliE [Bryobacteraceae bacterium]MCX7605577.1 flagellar hook-basal body complex protein FliE [Bryobacteraceae bacterium]